MEIVCEKVTKTLGSKVSLQDISLSLQGGQIYGLWGKNGSGKTMLMRLFAGLIRPSSGKIWLDGRELSHSFPPSIGLLLENPAFLDDYTGYKNLKLLAGLKGLVSDQEIADTLERIGLDPKDKRVYRKYSLGMRQRLGIACAIMEKPELVLLDEPINALDVRGVAQIRGILEEEKKRGALVVVSCHDADEMEALADVIFSLEEGRIVGKRQVERESV